MKKRDILFLCQYFYPEYISSATLPFDTAVALARAGFKVDALCGYPSEYNLKGKVPKKEICEDVSIKRLKYIQLNRTNFIGRILNYFSFTFIVALNFLRFRHYKAIIVYSNPPILPFIASMAHKFFKTKIVFVSYDVYPEMAYITKSVTKDSIISKVMKVVNKSLYKHLNTVVALSDEMKHYLLENRPTLLEQQVTVIPNWYEDNKTKDSNRSIQNSILSNIRKNNQLIVSYFGNMGICQDLDTIIDAIRLLKDEDKIHFLFAGHGNKKEKLKETISNEKLTNVSVFDFLHGDDFQDALDISDCFLVSLADGLTGLCVPSKTYSYMMAGKPIIAIMGNESDIVKDLEYNKAGFGIQIGDVSNLVSVINELKEDRELRVIMGTNCRDVYLDKYVTDKCTDKYVQRMKSVLEEC